MARRRRRLRLGRALLLSGAAIALVGVGYLFGRGADERARVKPARELAQHPREKRAETFGERPIGRVAIVVDDLGRSLAEVERLLALRVPLSFAVLPWESQTRQVVARLRQARVEILCHLPMEASGGQNPGPNAIFERLSAERIEALTAAALDETPGAVGVNNHMGSQITADEIAMGAILRVVGRRGLFFLDSRTTAASVADALARSAGIASARRDVFLDGVRDPNAIRSRFSELVALARQNGAAIGIAHPYAETLTVLESEVAAARGSGVRFVPVSALVAGGGGAAE